jgi:hypothetical protein
MTKARILADFISDGSSLADGTISVAEVSGAAPLASPTFTGTAVFNGGFAANVGSTITTADNTSQLTLISTDADASSGPQMTLYRNSSSPADNDFIGRVRMIGRNDNSQDFVGVDMIGRIIDASDGTEDSEFRLATIRNGTESTDFKITPTEVVFNEDSADLDFRVESDTNANALFVEGSSGNVGIGSSTANHFSIPGTANILGVKSSSGALVSIAATGTSFSGIDLGTDSLRRAGMYSLNGSVLSFYTNPTNSGTGLLERMSIDSSGGLITNPAAGGHAVFNEGGIDADFRVESDAGPYAFYMDAGVNSGYGRTKITSSAIYSNTSAGGGTSDTYINGLTIENNEATYTNGGLALVNKYSWGYGSAIKWYNIYDGAGTGGTLGETNSIHSQYVSANNMDTVFSSMISGALTETLSIGANGTVVNDGAIDNDFRVESVGSTHALFVDAANNRVGVLASAPRVPLEVGSNGTAVGMSETQIALAAFNGSHSAGLTFFDDNGEANAQQFYFDPGTCTLKLQTTTDGGTNKYNRMEIQGNAAGGEVSFNQDGQNHDFRVESVGHSDMFNIDASGNIVAFGKTGNVGGASTEGAYFSHGASQHFHFVITNESTNATHAALYINRQSVDNSQLVNFMHADTVEGNISVNGSTVTYNGFSGRHESSGIPANTPVGTVVSTIDELDVYPDRTTNVDGNAIDHLKAGQTRADHAKVEVSTSEGDACVYGVVSEFDGDGKLIVTSVGIGSIRVTGACSKGDLLESNGDGTAKVQSDDIIRSKTIGKVTIGNSDTGVKLVACVMYCG